MTRRPQPDDQPHLDWGRIVSGEIPWTSDEYMEVLNFRMMLAETPQDDWDNRPRRFEIEVAPGMVEGYQMNTLAYENQIGFYINRKYADSTTAASHLMRYFEMNFFLKQHTPRFRKEGFIRDDPEVAGKIEVNEALFRALADARYTRIRKGGHRTFDLKAIVARTRELITEEDAEEDANS